MIDAQQLLTEITRLVQDTTRATPEETTEEFNRRLADAGFNPAAVASIGYTFGVSWNMQASMSPEEAISGAFTTGILIGYRHARGELSKI